MKFGFVLPKGDAQTAAQFARLAEESGWDGFFVWEPVWGIDAWVCLSAAAMVTEHIRLGTMLTPLSRMRPWKLASETATLDNLSNGRVILSVGLGAVDTGFAEFGEITNRGERAELLDEGLEILTGLWSGVPYHHSGKHYRLNLKEDFFQLPPPPVQKPRIPIWVVGAWPREKSMRRALQYDGLLPNVMGEDGKIRMGPPTAEEIHQMNEFITTNRNHDTPFDIIVEGETPGADLEKARAIVNPYREAGATWWIEALWDEPDLERVSSRIKQGPPPGESDI
jgi:hypothetical protein